MYDTTVYIGAFILEGHKGTTEYVATLICEV